MLFVWTPVMAQDAEPLRAALQKQTELKSVKVKFRQSKKAPALVDPIQTMGELWLIPGKAFRWELGSPKKQTVVYDGKSVYVLDELKKTGEKLSPDDRTIKPLFLTLGMGEDATYDGLTKLFTITSTNQAQGRFVATMVPKSRRLRSMVKSLLMQVNLETSFPERIGWTQKDGTEAMTEFFKPALNGGIPASTFQVDESAYQWEK
ncbi:outer membrane lipoprotein carrier protein LolA [Verrucomicrobiaceae bacterium 227]